MFARDGQQPEPSGQYRLLVTASPHAVRHVRRIVRDRISTAHGLAGVAAALDEGFDPATRSPAAESYAHSGDSTMRYMSRGGGRRRARGRFRSDNGGMAANNNREIPRMHGTALDFFSAGVHAVRTGQWDAPTPCTDWCVRDLVNHLVVEQLWVAPLVRDELTVAEVGDVFEGDQLADDPVAAWDRAAEAARAAFGEPGVLDRIVHLSYGDTRAAAYCAQMTTDAAVHGWDLARAIGADEAMPDRLATASLHEVEPYAADLHKSGLFAAPVTPAPDADDQTRLLNLLGRRP